MQRWKRSERAQKILKKWYFSRTIKYSVLLLMHQINILQRLFKADVFEGKFFEKLSKRSYLFQHLLHYTCEMYNYKFTVKKFALPTPAVNISFLSQLLVNIEEFHNKSKLVAKTVHRIPDKWGYALKEGNGYIYRT